MTCSVFDLINTFLRHIDILRRSNSFFYCHHQLHLMDCLALTSVLCDLHYVDILYNMQTHDVGTNSVYFTVFQLSMRNWACSRGSQRQRRTFRGPMSYCTKFLTCQWYGVILLQSIVLSLIWSTFSGEVHQLLQCGLMLHQNA